MAQTQVKHFTHRHKTLLIAICHSLCKSHHNLVESCCLFRLSFDKVNRVTVSLRSFLCLTHIASIPVSVLLLQWPSFLQGWLLFFLQCGYSTEKCGHMHFIHCCSKHIFSRTVCQKLQWSDDLFQQWTAVHKFQHVSSRHQPPPDRKEISPQRKDSKYLAAMSTSFFHPVHCWQWLYSWV